MAGGPLYAVFHYKCFREKVEMVFFAFGNLNPRPDRRVGATPHEVFRR